MEEDMTSAKSRIDSLLDEIEQLDNSWAGVSTDLRMSLVQMILKHLREKGWTQGRLANEAGLRESFVSRVLHSNANCTLDTIGRLLHALGVRARFQETQCVKDATESCPDMVFVAHATLLHALDVRARLQVTECVKRATESWADMVPVAPAPLIFKWDHTTCPNKAILVRGDVAANPQYSEMRSSR